jgi:hypothetical protein
VANDTLIDLDFRDRLLLKNVLAANLHASDFGERRTALTRAYYRLSFPSEGTLAT